MMTDKVKLFAIEGYYVKRKEKFSLYVECRATKIEHALEKAYSEVGSRHKVKRENIYISKDDGIKEIDISQAKNPLFEDLEQEDFVIYK